MPQLNQLDVAACQLRATQRPREQPVEIEVVLIATYEEGNIKHLLELTWPDWTWVKALEAY